MHVNIKSREIINAAKEKEEGKKKKRRRGGSILTGIVNNMITMPRNKCVASFPLYVDGGLDSYIEDAKSVSPLSRGDPFNIRNFTADGAKVYDDVFFDQVSFSTSINLFRPYRSDRLFDTTWGPDKKRLFVQIPPMYVPFGVTNFFDQHPPGGVYDNLSNGRGGPSRLRLVLNFDLSDERHTNFARFIERIESSVRKKEVEARKSAGEGKTYNWITLGSFYTYKTREENIVSLKTSVPMQLTAFLGNQRENNFHTGHHLPYDYKCDIENEDGNLLSYHDNDLRGCMVEGEIACEWWKVYRDINPRWNIIRLRIIKRNSPSVDGNR